jgi:NAD(P)-dependent dehydrogenase (short-subunit alcohol dehydrogenase family)
MESSKVAVVVGVGPGLGGAVARRFAREGYGVALLARRLDSLRETHEQILAAGGRALSLPMDTTDATSVANGFDEIVNHFGDPEVLVYNAGAFKPGGILEVTPEEFESSWKANCMGGFLAARAVIPAMLTCNRGTLIFTGATASRRGSASFSCLSVGKFGLRALAQSLARELGPRGIHVVHAVIDGQIDVPGSSRRQAARAAHTLLDPDSIAKTYWDIHSQDPTAWTQELDLRPAVEKF